MSGETGVIIAGAAETDAVGRLPDHSTLQLHIEAAVNAVADAGLSMRDIDGIATVTNPGPMQVAVLSGGTGPAEPAFGERHRDSHTVG